MIRSAMAIAALVAAFTGVSAAAKPAGEERLARLLVGRVAERPVRCISHSVASNVQVIDRTALVYGFGRVIYVNRTATQQNIRSRYVMVYRNRSGQLCRSDTVYLMEQGSRTRAGFISLDHFVPWRRVR